MEFFAEILNFFKLLTIFAKKLHRRCLSGLKMGFWLRVWNIEFTLVLSLQIKPRKCSAGKYVWDNFWKGEKCLYRSSRLKGSLKEVIWEISQNSQENLCAGIYFFDICSFIKNETLTQVFSCEFWKICRNAFFAEHHQTTASDDSSINSSEGRIRKRNCKLWYKN